MNVSATQKLRHDDVRMILEIATAAPSVLNTQPWRFNVSNDEIDLLADQSRALPVADPNGRQLTLSCGAALFNLRLAVRSLGREPVVLLLPRAADPSLLATVRFVGHAGSDPGLDSLLPYVPKRRTNRGPFTDESVPPAVLSQLQTAAQLEEAMLHVLSGVQAWRVPDLVRGGGFALRGDERFVDEVSRWVHDQPGRSDGIPARSLGPRATDPSALVRDFAHGRRIPDRESAAFEQNPTLVLLSSPRDERADWLRAGQALQRVLLLATKLGIAASFLNQPIDREATRWMVRDPHAPVSYPQMLMRLGYGTEVPPTPRRPVDEVMA